MIPKTSIICFEFRCSTHYYDYKRCFLPINLWRTFRLNLKCFLTYLNFMQKNHRKFQTTISISVSTDKVCPLSVSTIFVAKVWEFGLNFCLWAELATVLVLVSIPRDCRQGYLCFLGKSFCNQVFKLKDLFCNVGTVYISRASRKYESNCRNRVRCRSQ